VSLALKCDECGGIADFQLPRKFGNPKVLQFELSVSRKRGVEAVSLDLCRFCLASLLTSIASQVAPEGVKIHWSAPGEVVPIPERKQSAPVPAPVKEESRE